MTKMAKQVVKQELRRLLNEVESQEITQLQVLVDLKKMRKYELNDYERQFSDDYLIAVQQRIEKKRILIQYYKKLLNNINKQ